MKIVTTDVAVVGGGPAGMCAALQAARAGARTILIDENSRPGGQLFKQIHKFFGSRDHQAGTRGFSIGTELLNQVTEAGVEVWLDSLVYGIQKDKTLGVIRNGKNIIVNAKKVILAAGAKENYLAFPGSTLPGVMGAGAAQTMVNVNRVLPGERVLMLGAGNVGLIVSYQLMQAGAEVVALVEGAPRIGGYGVHAGKLRRAGIPFYLGHTIKSIEGNGKVEKVTIAAVDPKWNHIEGSEKTFAVDTVCLAAGLNPMTELAWMAGCEFTFIPAFGGHVPLHDEKMETTVSGLYVAGDITGPEEASSAMEEGNMAGVCAAESLGYLTGEQAGLLREDIQRRLNTLRSGMFGEKRAQAKSQQIASMRARMSGRQTAENQNSEDDNSHKLLRTSCPQNVLHSVASSAQPEIGFSLKQTCSSPHIEAAASSLTNKMGVSTPEKNISEHPGVAYTGIPSQTELASCPGIPSIERLKKGRTACIECVQEIPCNPCENSCKFGAITIGGCITNLPRLDAERCIGCGMCVANCPGLAITLLDLSFSETEGTVDFPYEYLPLPKEGDIVDAVDRSGNGVCKGTVLKVTKLKSYAGTTVIRIRIPAEYIYQVRSIKSLPRTFLEV